jgi:hypothetical protein
VRIVLAFLIAFSASAQVPGFTPVDAENLQGRKLVLKKFNCSIEAPAGSWKWLQREHPENRLTTFAAVDREHGGALMLYVEDRQTRNFDEAAVRQYAAGALRGMRQTGIEPGAVTVEPTNVPLPGSFRYRYDAHMPDGRTIPFSGVFAHRYFTYWLQDSSPQPDPQRIDRFAESFKLLGDPPVSPVDFGGSLFRDGIALLLVIVFAGAYNNSKNRRAVNGGIGAAVLIAFEYSLILWFLLRALDPLGDDGLRQQEIGGLFGAIVIPLAIAIWLAMRFERERTRERAETNLAPLPITGGSIILGVVVMFVALMIAPIALPQSRPAMGATAIITFVLLVFAIVAFVRRARVIRAATS